MRKRIAVVGAGTVGLATAERLAHEFDVEIIAQCFGSKTASRKATAIWHVYLVEETDQVLSLAEHTLTTLYGLRQNDEKCGIGLAQGVELFRTQPFVIPVWAHIPRLFRLLTGEELTQFNSVRASGLTLSESNLLESHPVQWGYHIEAPVADMLIYLPWLEARVRSLGVTFREATLDRLDDLGADFDLVVNCTGAGARHLCGDADILPVRGQYFVLNGTDDAPTTYVGDDDNPLGMSYVIPRLGEVMVGGTAEPGVESESFELSWDDLQRRASLYAPWIASHSYKDFGKRQVSGVRPFRKGGIRLEIETAEKRTPVLHNYGHGGSGFSLSWGCADVVLKMALRHLG